MTASLEHGALGGKPSRGVAKGAGPVPPFRHNP